LEAEENEHGWGKEETLDDVNRDAYRLLIVVEEPNDEARDFDDRWVHGY
jgi:hypothetical protein